MSLIGCVKKGFGAEEITFILIFIVLIMKNLNAFLPLKFWKKNKKKKVLKICLSPNKYCPSKNSYRKNEKSTLLGRILQILCLKLRPTWYRKRLLVTKVVKKKKKYCSM